MGSTPVIISPPADFSRGRQYNVTPRLPLLQINLTTINVFLPVSTPPVQARCMNGDHVLIPLQRHRSRSPGSNTQSFTSLQTANITTTPVPSVSTISGGSSPQNLGARPPDERGSASLRRGGLEQSPSGVQRESPWSEAFSVFGRSMNPQICPLFETLETQRHQIFVLSLQKITSDHETGGLDQNWGLCPSPPARA